MTDILDMLQKGGPWGFAAICLFAVAYLFVDGRKREREQSDARIEDLKIIVPLAAKQNDAIASLERVVNMLMAQLGRQP